MDAKLKPTDAGLAILFKKSFLNFPGENQYFGYFEMLKNADFLRRYSQIF